MTESVTQTPIFSPGAPPEPPREGGRASAYALNFSPGGAPPLTRDPAEEDFPRSGTSLEARISW